MHTIRKITAGILLCCSAVYAQQITGQSGVLFETASWELSPQAGKTLDSICLVAKQRPLLTFTLSGHTDSRGSDSYNDDLSEKRTSAVRDYLLNCGLAEDRISFSSEGEKKPVADNVTNAGMSLNRRVEIAANALQEMREDETYARKWQAAMTPEVQKFTCVPAAWSCPAGRQGTVVIIPPRTMAKSGEMEVSLTEAYDYKSMMQNALVTTSGGRQLESGGMFSLEVSVNGRQVPDSLAKEALVLMPADEILNNMNVFYSAIVSDKPGMEWTSNGARMNFLSGSSIPLQKTLVNTAVKKKKSLPGRVAASLANIFLPKEKSIPGYRMVHLVRRDWDREKIAPIAEAAGLTVDEAILFLGNAALTKSVDATKQYYAFRPQTFTWINCDRFAYVSADQLTSLVIQVPDSVGNPELGFFPEFRMFFRNISSVMDAYQTAPGEYRFGNIPAGEKVVVTGMVMGPGKAPLVWTQEITVEKNGILVPEFKRMLPETFFGELPDAEAKSLASRNPGND